MRFRFVLPLVILLLAQPGCRMARLKGVDPIPVAKESVEQTRDVVFRALTAQRWTIVSEKPGVMQAMLSGGGWSVVINVEFDADTVTLRYVDSDHLNYRKTRKGREYIHKNYNIWMRRLAAQIQRLGRSAKIK